VDLFPVLHQWHCKHSPAYPTAWYLDMVNHLYFDNNRKDLRKEEFGILVETSTRSILNKLNEPNCFKKLELIPDPLFQFTFFMDAFFKMSSEEFGQFEFLIQSPL